MSASLFEYGILADLNRADPGPVTFSVTNDGTIAHQFIVIATDIPAADLPVNATTGEVEMEAEGLDVIWVQESFEPGEQSEQTLELEPGQYAFICNLTGHYDQGMYYDFVVAAVTP